jgi:hypothetical protein
VVAALETPDFDEDWAPDELDRSLYRADLRVKSLVDRDVVVFMCGSTGAADRSAVVLERFRSHTDRALEPLLAYHPTYVSSSAVYRFQDVAASEDSLVAVEPGGSKALVKALAEKKVLVTQ